MAILEEADKYVQNLVYLAEKLAAGFHVLKQLQTKVSGLVGAVPEEGIQPTPDQWRQVILALIVEHTELLQELDWKPWKVKNDVDIAKVKEEFADILAFTGLLIIYFDRLGISTSELATEYLIKSKINYARLSGQIESYEPRKEV